MTLSHDKQGTVLLLYLWFAHYQLKLSPVGSDKGRGCVFVFLAFQALDSIRMDRNVVCSCCRHYKPPFQLLHHYNPIWNLTSSSSVELYWRSCRSFYRFNSNYVTKKKKKKPLSHESNHWSRYNPKASIQTRSVTKPTPGTTKSLQRQLIVEIHLWSYKNLNE